ncbi:MAG: hypothetical protein SGPRY_014272 [Prymnesium sp.]
MRSALPVLAEAEEVPMPLRFAASTPHLGESHAAPTPRRPIRHATSDLGPALFTTARECDESMANDFFTRLSPTLTRKGRPKNWITLGNDILALPEITLTSMLQTLSSRFEKSIVYTNIGEILLSKARDTVVSDSVIISGESGAGKTEAAKLCLAVLIDCDSARYSSAAVSFSQKLMLTGPIFEALGNATT